MNLMKNTEHNSDAEGRRTPPTCSATLVWHAGPANGGEGTAGLRDGDPWWDDGDLLLVIVDVVGGREMRLLNVHADGPESLDFSDPETGNFDFGWTDRQISWWARIKESLPQNDQDQP